MYVCTYLVEIHANSGQARRRGAQSSLLIKAATRSAWGFGSPRAQQQQQRRLSVDLSLLSCRPGCGGTTSTRANSHAKPSHNDSSFLYLGTMSYVAGSTLCCTCTDRYLTLLPVGPGSAALNEPACLLACLLCHAAMRASAASNWLSVGRALALPCFSASPFRFRFIRPIVLSLLEYLRSRHYHCIALALACPWLRMIIYTNIELQHQQIVQPKFPQCPPPVRPSSPAG